MIVQVENLVKRYGNLLALDHLNLHIEKGEIFGLLGPNGSGKTTAINCILSLLTFDKGTIRLFDAPMSPDAYDLKRHIGVVMQNVAVFQELTVYENIRYFCGLYIDDKRACKRLTEEAIDFTGLADFASFYPKKLSGGLLRRLNIACGIAHKPQLIILDEPTVAVDPQSRNSILEGIVRLNAQGATVIYTSHYMEEVEQICTRIAILDKGRVIASGTTDALKGMIAGGETINVEMFTLSDAQLATIRSWPQVLDATYTDHQLCVRCREGQYHLIALLDYFRQEDLQFGHVYTKQPTLNDVFLAITGKELRD